VSTRAARRGEDRGNSLPPPVACTSVAPTYSWPSVSAPTWQKEGHGVKQEKKRRDLKAGKERKRASRVLHPTTPHGDQGVETGIRLYLGCRWCLSTCYSLNV
jgi:hypothetical protein